jgi:type I restriction enzyme, S subunit
MTTQTLKKWNKVKLGQVLTLNYGKGLPARDRVDGEYPVYGSAGIVGSHNSFVAEGPGIVVGRKGSIGEIYISKKNYYPIDTAYYVNSSDKYDIFFIYYLLKTLSLKTLNTDAAVPGLNRNIAYQQEFFLPDIPTQKQIADVLSTYDDLIENNTRRIQILEQLAQAIYTEWFVNFHFPDYEKVKMIDSKSDFGKIPEEWEVAKMGDIAEFMNGYAFKPRHLGTKGLPVIKIPELRSGILSKTPRNSGESIPKKYFIKNGDILFSWSATLLVNIWNSGEGLLNQHLFKVTPKADYLYSFIFYLLTNQIEKYRSHAVGATMQHLRRDVVINANVLLPNKDLLIKFENIALDILKERSILIIQNQNLRQTRDLLLPKLVTGEIVVK